MEEEKLENNQNEMKMQNPEMHHEPIPEPPKEPVDIQDIPEPPKPRRHRRQRRHRSGESFFFKFVISMILIIVLAGTIIFGIVYISKTLNKDEAPVTIQMTVESTLLTCQELVTSKYYYRQVDFIKRQNSAMSKSSSYVLLKYTGVLRAGISDLTACTFEIDEEKNSICINTPKIEILGNEISDYEVLDEYQKTFKTLSVRDTMRELDSRKRQIENEAIASGFLSEAEAHAKLTLEKLFTAAGFSSVEVICPEIVIENEMVDYGVEVAPAH